MDRAPRNEANPLPITGSRYARPSGRTNLSKEAEAAFFIKTEGGINRILLSEDGNEDGMGFYFYRRLSPDQKWSVPLYSACRLNDQTLRALAEAPAQRPADDPYAWDHRADTYPHRSQTLPF
jgi:hypothetical protein